MEFIAEIKQTKQIKKSSLDQEYQILLVTDDSNVLDLGKYPYDTVFRVNIGESKNGR